MANLRSFLWTLAAVFFQLLVVTFCISGCGLAQSVREPANTGPTEITLSGSQQPSATVQQFRWSFDSATLELHVQTGPSVIDWERGTFPATEYFDLLIDGRSLSEAPGFGELSSALSELFRLNWINARCVPKSRGGVVKYVSTFWLRMEGRLLTVPTMMFSVQSQ